MITAVCIENDGATLFSNPGMIGGGAAILTLEGVLLKELVADFKMKASNNVAEYSIVTTALDWVSREIPEVTSVHLRTDSQLVVNQVAGNWKIRSQELQKLAEKTWQACQVFDLVTIEWIRRELNEHADALSKCAVKGTWLPGLIDRAKLGVGPYPYVRKDRTFVVRDSSFDY